MPAVSRQGDSLTTGHICVATTTLATPGQSTVFANGILVARITDSTVSHLFPPNVPPCGSHTSTVKPGRKCARIGDAADAGAMTSGSGDVFAGG